MSLANSEGGEILLWGDWICEVIIYGSGRAKTLCKHIRLIVETSM